MKIFAAVMLFIFSLGTGFAETRDAETHFFDMKMGDL